MNSSSNRDSSCDPKEVALKSFFLGPQAENAPWVSELLNQIFVRWVTWRKTLFPDDGFAISALNQESKEFEGVRRHFEETTYELVNRLENEVPKFSPRYVGHMFSEVSLPALLGHIVTLLHNPNNISGEASRVGIQIEDEAVRFLLKMAGYSESESSGHFTSGGTIANFEAITRASARLSLWLAAQASAVCDNKSSNLNLFEAPLMGWEKFKTIRSQIESLSKWHFSSNNPWELSRQISKLAKKEYLGPVMLVPQNKHYSWVKGSHLYGGGGDSLWSIQLDSRGRLDVSHLKQLLEKAELESRPVLMVVSVVGTTELGGIDPVDEVQDLLDRYKNERGIHIWHHVDGAYGGFFRTLDLENSNAFPKECMKAIRAISRVDSLAIDPHKLGYVPYASGAFLCREKINYFFSSFEDAPYLDFDKSIDRGPFTLEGSRSAAGAVATWMTAKTMGLHKNGHGLLLERTTRIKQLLEKKLLDEKLPIQITPGSDTNILCFICAQEGEPLSKSNEKTLKLYEAFSPKINGEFIVSKTTLHSKSYGNLIDSWTKNWNAKKDTDQITVIRMCMMNPFFGSIETNVNYLELFTDLLKIHLKTST